MVRHTVDALLILIKEDEQLDHKQQNHVHKRKKKRKRRPPTNLPKFNRRHQQETGNTSDSIIPSNAHNHYEQKMFEFCSKPQLVHRK